MHFYSLCCLFLPSASHGMKDSVEMESHLKAAEEGKAQHNDTVQLRDYDYNTSTEKTLPEEINFAQQAITNNRRALALISVTVVLQVTALAFCDRTRSY